MVGKLVRSVAAVAGLALVLGLSACNTNYDVLGPYALGYEDGELLFAICEPMQVDRISLSVTTRDTGRAENRLVWVAEGDLAAKQGDVFVVGGQNDGLSNVVVGEDPPVNGAATYFVGLNDRGSATLTASFWVPDSGLVEGMWLTPTDEMRTSPCGSTSGFDPKLPNAGPALSR